MTPHIQETNFFRSYCQAGATICTKKAPCCVISELATKTYEVFLGSGLILTQSMQFIIYYLLILYLLDTSISVYCIWTTKTHTVTMSCTTNTYKYIIYLRGMYCTSHDNNSNYAPYMYMCIFNASCKLWSVFVFVCSRVTLFNVCILLCDTYVAY